MVRENVRRVFRGGVAVAGLMAAFALAAPAQADLLQTSGTVTFLRVHEVGTRFGPPGDQIDVEVVVKLSGQDDKAYGFRLRNGDGRPVAQGMLDILRDAFNHGHRVTIDFRLDPPKKNGEIMRVALVR